MADMRIDEQELKRMQLQIAALEEELGELEAEQYQLQQTHQVALAEIERLRDKEQYLLGENNILRAENGRIKRQTIPSRLRAALEYGFACPPCGGLP